MDTDCADCQYKRPRLEAENYTVWRLWDAIRTQWRTSFGGAVGLDFIAVKAIADVLDIELTPNLLKKLAKLEAMNLDKWAKKSEVKTSGSK